ncbi:MAG TPA: alpha/beta fold hydrolase [Candidatus Saccharimonadales bacterium]|nr:alpha/beta fold hydrolase [Candidatus Saccharimonadales bacterium]
MFDVFTHRWLRIPYTLHAHVDQKPKKPIATVLLIHGIGNSGAAWDSVVAKLPDSIHVISIDLLGFGNSPRPAWAIYNAKTQARSVLTTLLKLKARHPIIIVGHSLGALVAVEFAKRYPLLVRSLILVSPPFYQSVTNSSKQLPNADRMRREIYRLIKKRPDQLIQIANLALKLGLLNKTFNLTKDNASIYLNALEASILNQTSLHDAEHLKLPIRILYGMLDPVIASRNLAYLAQKNKYVRTTAVLASHEVLGTFASKVADAIKASVTDEVAGNTRL